MPGLLWAELLLLGCLLMGLRRRYAVRPHVTRAATADTGRRNGGGRALAPALLATGLGLACASGWALTPPVCMAWMLGEEVQRLKQAPAGETPVAPAAPVTARLAAARGVRPADLLVAYTPLLSLQLVLAGLVAVLTSLLSPGRGALGVALGTVIVLVAGAGLSALLGLGLLAYAGLARAEVGLRIRK